MNVQDFKKLIEENPLYDEGLENIFFSLSEDERLEILMDVDFIKNKLYLEDFEITELIKTLSSDEAKDKLIDTYHLEKDYKIDILKTCSNEHKMDILLKEKDFKNLDIINLLQTLDVKTLSDFLKEHKKFLIERGIHPYAITRDMDAEQQKEFILNLENIDLTLAEKKEIMVTLNEEVTQGIDEAELPDEYRIALSLPTNATGSIEIDLERNLEDYRGLDNLIIVNPEKFTEEQREKFLKLCDICPNLRIFNEVCNRNRGYFSSAKEYKEAEEWIDSLISSLNPEYSDAQKIAVIDNAIGRKLSYSPNFDTETFNELNSRALWRVISSGYGVCNGIATIENYIFSRIGIDSEVISSDGHAFLKIKNLELPLANGETVKGNTILDPTWNLSAHRVGAKPNNFCISYEQARENDIDREGKDQKCHKNDEQLKDANLSLDDESLRKLFSSVGLADRDGQFQVKELMENSELIDKFYANQPEENINRQLLLLRHFCPDFATSQMESMQILSQLLLKQKNMQFNKCVVNRVYDKSDEEKKVVLYVYVDSEELGKRFYVADKEKNKFVELPQEEFTRQFECYDQDLKKMNGVRPWETREQEKESEDLSKSSGKIVANGGQER